MKNIKDLKKEIINKNFQRFYVFYGEDYGLRYHYIKELSKTWGKIVSVNDFESLNTHLQGVNLFSMKSLYVLHGAIDFAKLPLSVMENFVKRIPRDNVVVFCYEEELPSSNLWKYYNNNITYFPVVDEKIAIQFVDSEVSLNEASKNKMVTNCEKNYNNILLEADKIKNYAQAMNISEQEAFDNLDSSEQLLYKFPTFHSDEMMNDVLTGNSKNLAYWYYLAKNTFWEDFWITLENIMNNYLIAYFIKRDGKYNGGTNAYNLGLNWGRIKIIREFNIPYDADYLLEAAFKVARLDENVKSGRIAYDEVFDYFLCLVY